MDYLHSKQTMEGYKMGIDRKTHRLREESLARKRNEEYHRQLYWNGIKDYYKAWDLRASKYNVWASQPQSPISAEREKELEKEDLQKRRAKLAKLLEEEQKQLEEEVKNFIASQKKSKSSNQFDDEESDLLNAKVTFNEEDEARYKSSVRKHDHQKRISHPILQDIEKKKCQDSMKKCLIEQMKERQQQQEYEKELMQKLEEENERQRIIEEQREIELACKRQEEAKQLKDYLLNQMQEVKKRDELTSQLKKQEQQEIKLKTNLEKIAVRRNEIENQRKKKELCSFLRHQYQLHLKQRSREIQQQLDEDKRWIDEITRCVEQEEAENNKIREEARKEVDRANTILTEYTRLEKQREREIEFMFFEEARKMWQKQEAQWKAEQEARDRLMRDVIVSIQKQVKEKLGQNAQKHKSLADEKEELLRHIEKLNNQLKDAELDACRRKKEYKDELQRQMQEKEHEKADAEQEKQREYLEQQAKLKEEEEAILQELRKINTSSVSPVGRPSTLWHL